MMLFIYITTTTHNTKNCPERVSAVGYPPAYGIVFFSQRGSRRSYKVSGKEVRGKKKRVCEVCVRV